MRAIQLAFVAVAATIVAGMPGLAQASWSAAGSGAAASAAFSMPVAGAPTGTASGRTVDLSWPVTAFPNGDPVGGYLVARYDVLTGLPQTVSTGCNGLLAAASCTESAVPPGQWSYTVTAVQSGWTGAEGPASSTIAVESPLLAFSSPTTITSLPATLAGSVNGFLPGESVVFRLDDPVTGSSLSGSIAPDPIAADGSATVSVTVPGGTARGAHTVYAVGSLGAVAGAAISVADTTAPSITAAVLGKTEGGTPGFVRQGGTYYVYATVVDPGDPASGVAGVTADVSAVTTGQTAVPMTAGSYTIGGVTYTHQSAALTASNPLSSGATAFSITAADVDGNAATQSGFSVTVDNTRPSAADVQTANSLGGTVGRAETGDTITYTFSEAVEPASILAGWNGTTTTVTVRLVQANPRDRLEIWNSSDATQLPFGSVDLGGNTYTAGTGARFAGSTMVMTGESITIKLGTPTGTVGTETKNGDMVWNPIATPHDLAGNVCLPAAGAETGAVDREF